MATIDVIGLCAGGGHIIMDVTTVNGTKRVTAEMNELRAAIKSETKESIIMAQLAGLVRANPGATQVQLRNIVEAYTFLE